MPQTKPSAAPQRVQLEPPTALLGGGQLVGPQLGGGQFGGPQLGAQAGVGVGGPQAGAEVGGFQAGSQLPGSVSGSRPTSGWV